MRENINRLLKSLIEIFDGYSRFDLNGQTLFFRHFGLRDQNNVSEIYKNYEIAAKAKGSETEEEVYKRLVAEGDWSSDEDLKISNLEVYISNLKTSKTQIILPSQKESHQKIIDEESAKLNELLAKKQSLVGVTVEHHANKMANEEFLRLLIYKDAELKHLQFGEDDFGKLDYEFIGSISSSYYELVSSFSDLNIQEVVLQDFFNIYLSSCEDPNRFFGKPIFHLSAYQMKLLLYGRIFYNIFQYNDDIPDYIRKDPKAIFEFVESKKNRESFQSTAREGTVSTVFGATSKDLDVLDPSAKRMSLTDEIQKNGGSLDMEQMMRLMNQ